MTSPSEPSWGDIGSRIANVRREKGISQLDLGRAIGLERDRVSKIESGSRRISALELAGLAEALAVPIDFFVRDAPPAIYSRRAALADEDQTSNMDVLVESLSRDVEFLARKAIIDVPSRHTQPMPQSLSAAEHAAIQVRRELNLGSAPLLDIQRIAESLGMLLFVLATGSHRPEASYVSVDGFGIALIEATVDPGRRRFDAAHELGHHIFGDAFEPLTLGPGDAHERLINAFAAHLLLPRAAVSARWQQQSIAGIERRLTAVELAARYRVSWTVVCNQLKTFGCVDQHERDFLVETPPTPSDFVAAGERWTSEMDAPSVPPQFGAAVMAAFRSGSLTSERTLELLRGTVASDDLPDRDRDELYWRRRDFNVQ